MLMISEYVDLSDIFNAPLLLACNLHSSIATFTYRNYPNRFSTSALVLLQVQFKNSAGILDMLLKHPSYKKLLGSGGS